MCGIVGAIANKNVVPDLLEGLRRLEYRGYDSAGVAVVTADNSIQRVRSEGKVANVSARADSELNGVLGIAHTRWATHGVPSEQNAHPHICRNRVAIVHNGIIENFETLKHSQLQDGYAFTSDTDSEVIVHELHKYLDQGANLLDAVRQATRQLEGAYALGVVEAGNTSELIAARQGCPLIVGLSEGENLIASDVSAVLQVTNRYIILEEGDIARVTIDKVEVYDSNGALVGSA